MSCVSVGTMTVQSASSIMQFAFSFLMFSRLGTGRKTEKSQQECKQFYANAEIDQKLPLLG